MIFLWLLVLFVITVKSELFLNASIDFAQTVIKGESTYSNNFVISPTALQTALTILRFGTSEITQENLNEVLYSNKYLDNEIITDIFEELYRYYLENPEPHNLLRVHNALFYKNTLTLKSDYIHLVANNFGAEVEPFKFSNKRLLIRYVNEWYSDILNQPVTDGITYADLVPEPGAVLSNTIQFSAKWKRPFIHLDKPFYQKFHVNNTYEVLVPFMRQIGYSKYIRYNGLNVESLEIPFLGDNQTLKIYLPINTTDTSQIKSNLASLIQDKRIEYSQTLISLPKFVLDTTTHTKQILDALGYELFSNTYYPLITHLPFRINDITHKAVLNFSEEGVNLPTTAKDPVKSRKSSLPTTSFEADRPFVFVIIDDTAGVIFAGECSDPSKTN